jgi:hypothetical protein
MRRNEGNGCFAYATQAYSAALYFFLQKRMGDEVLSAPARNN